MTSFKKRLSSTLIAATLGIALPVLADTGGLRIKLLDSDGNPVANAEVTIESKDSLVSKKATTDNHGYLKVLGLEPATNYVINVHKEGFNDLEEQNVRVVSGKNLDMTFGVVSDSESGQVVTITGSRVAAIDTTSAVVSTDITLDLTESLPTARNYQSYLQIAPGIKPTTGGNPSSKSGVNYSDIGGVVGQSTDNVYIIDGVNVTDNLSGTFGANFNSEIIQEQQVLTGGIPAEFEGGSGLVTKVVTKSGSNEFHGSVNYYLQNDSLVADDKHQPNSSFSTFDTAVTLGGPIIKDKLWFYSSYQLKNREDDVSDVTSGDFLRTVNTDQDLAFVKLSWLATDRDKLVFSFFNDPYDKDGSSDPTVLGNRDTAREQGGDNMKLEYTHDWDDLFLTVNYYDHNGQVSTFAKDQSTRNDVAFLTGSPTNAQLNVGGSGSNRVDERNKTEFSVALQYIMDTDFGEHEFKVGYSRITNERNLDFTYTGSELAQYTSIGSVDSGATLGDYTGGGWTGPTDISTGDYARIIDAINASSDSAFYMGLLDTDSSGDISTAELEALTFSDTTGNPGGNVNAYRIQMTQTAPVTFETKGQTFFLQDQWNYEDWTVNAGVRGEKWEHYATDGSNIMTFDWEFAPRVSVVYDINGDGESKVWAFGGRYYDPIRTNMTSFAGTLTGPVREEQVNIDGRWLTFRTRGGSQVQDAFFAPSTKTPYTDEFMLGYAKTIADDMSVSATYTKRVTKDILEDYDLGYYTDPNQVGIFALPLSYFGYSSVPDSNFVIGTLAGGERKYQGVEFTFRKHKSDNWQALASYTYNDAQGNTNSDSNADFQGDWVVLDPRAPNQYGDQPGNITHLLKFSGSYFWDNGLEVGAIYNWNSGVRYSRTWSIYGRHLPLMDFNGYEFGGVTDSWILPDAVGSQEADSYGTLDVRVKYKMDVGDRYEAEFFLDIFNVLDDQAGITQQDLVDGDGTYAFGENNSWVSPRRFYLGARLSF